MRTFNEDEFVQRLLSNDLASRAIAPVNKAFYQYAIVMEELMTSVVRKTVGQPNWQEVLRTRYDQFASMVEEFVHACDSRFIYDLNAKPRETRSDPDLRVLWRHRDLNRAFDDGTESTESCHVDRDRLSNIALYYLRQDARSGEFERLLVDALAAIEIYQFGESIKVNPSLFDANISYHDYYEESRFYYDVKGNREKLYSLRAKTRLKRHKKSVERALMLVALTIAGIVLGALMGSAWLIVLCAALLALLVGFYVVLSISHKQRPGDTYLQLFGKMVQAYSELQGPATSPTRCREVFSKVADEGAVWPPSVFAILDDAIHRSPGAWI
jgi:hypothetical protein